MMLSWMSLFLMSRKMRSYLIRMPFPYAKSQQPNVIARIYELDESFDEPLLHTLLTTTQYNTIPLATKIFVSSPNLPTVANFALLFFLLDDRSLYITTRHLTCDQTIIFLPLRSNFFGGAEAEDGRERKWKIGKYFGGWMHLDTCFPVFLLPHP